MREYCHSCLDPSNRLIHPRYAYPPDYSSRLDREAKDREAEVERERKRIVGGQWPGMPGTGGYLAMGPA